MARKVCEVKMSNEILNMKLGGRWNEAEAEECHYILFHCRQS